MSKSFNRTPAEKKRNDIYVKTMNRLHEIGVKTDKDAVIHLSEEIDFYKSHIRRIENYIENLDKKAKEYKP